MIQNRSFRNISFFVCLVLLFLASATVSAKEYIVSVKNESETEDGSLEHPYNTIGEATALAKAGDVISVRAGVYRETVAIPDDRVTFQTYQNEEVVINGTDLIYGWSQVKSSPVYKSVMNWDFAPEEGSNQIFVDQKMINLVRWPDQTSEDIIKPNDAIAESVAASGTIFTITDAEFNEPDGRWTGAQIWVNLSHNGADGQGWTGIVKTTNQSNHTITVDFGTEVRLGDQPWGLGKNTEYYLFNPTIKGVDASGGIANLLSTGEWWKKGDTLFVHAPNGAAPGGIGASQNIVEARKRQFAFRPGNPQVNNSYTVIRNFTLFAASITTDNNYNNRRSEIVEDAQGILIEGIKAKYLTHFTNQTGNWQDQWTGRSGIILSGVGNILKNCILQYSAGPAVCIMGFGNKLLNCTISEANYSNSNSGAVSTGYLSVDYEIAYNIISNTPMIAIAFKGSKNSNPNYKGVARIHHNEIYDFMRRGYDSGAIDEVGTDGQWLRIDHNQIYNTKPDAIAGQARYGVYLDFGGGSDVYEGRYIVDHNLIYNVYVPILINHINNAWVYNNTCVLVGDPKIAIVNGNGGTGKTDIIRNNIFGGTYNTDAWGSLKDALFQNNIFDAKGSVLNDLFVDPVNYNFELKPTATQAIDMGLDVSPFNDPLTGLPDLGSHEYGQQKWTAGLTDFFAPEISPNGGSFIGSVSVNLVSTSTEGVIRYTLDGTDPVATSPMYIEPIIINTEAIVKARIFKNENEFSEVSSASFVVEQLNLALNDAVTPTDLLPGLNYEYYDWWGGLGLEKLPDLAIWTPTRIGVAPVINLSESHEPDYFAFRFSGFIEIPEDGIYTFYTNSDDNSKLSVDNMLVVNNDNVQAPTERSGRIGLKAGFHAITVDFMEVGGGETLSASYKGPSISKRFLPANVLWHNQYVPKTAKVSISPDGSKFTQSVKVKMTCDTPGAQIYYTTNGSIPDKTSALYNQELTFSASTKVNAIAYSNALPESSVATADFMLSSGRVNINPLGGLFTEIANVKLSTTTSGATIVYTLDGSNPTINSAVYTDNVKITANAMLKVMSFKADFAESDIDSAKFSIRVVPPVIEPSGIAFVDSVMVSFSCATPDVIYFYTTNNSLPTISSKQYTGPFEITKTMNIRVIAAKAGMVESIAVKKGFTIYPTGIDDKSNPELKVFPNPSSDGKFTVQLPSSLANKKVLLRINDLAGRVVSEQWIESSANGTIQTLKPLGSGCYILNVSLGMLEYKRKLIVNCN